MANGYNKNNPGATYSKINKGNLTDRGYSSSTAGWAQGYNNPSSGSSNSGGSSNKGGGSSSSSSSNSGSSNRYACNN